MRSSLLTFSACFVLLSQGIMITHFTPTVDPFIGGGAELIQRHSSGGDLMGKDREGA